MNDTRLHPDLARVLRQVNDGHVSRDPETGDAWLQASLSGKPVDVTHWIRYALLDELVELAADGRYALTGDGVQALVAVGGRA